MDRPKRRCVARKTAVPSAVHYVGYVEDDETPEMIMRKFEVNIKETCIFSSSSNLHSWNEHPVMCMQLGCLGSWSRAQV